MLPTVSQKKEEASERTVFFEENRSQFIIDTWPIESTVISCIFIYQLTNWKSGKGISERKDNLDLKNKNGMVKNTIECKCFLK